MADPDALLVQANAIFRVSQQAATRDDLLHGMDRAIKAYGELMRSPTLTCDGEETALSDDSRRCDAVRSDAAYNLEYVSRLRDRMAARDAPSTDSSTGIRLRM